MNNLNCCLAYASLEFIKAENPCGCIRQFKQSALEEQGLP